MCLWIKGKFHFKYVAFAWRKSAQNRNTLSEAKVITRQRWAGNASNRVSRTLWWAPMRQALPRLAFIRSIRCEKWTFRIMSRFIDALPSSSLHITKEGVQVLFFGCYKARTVCARDESLTAKGTTFWIWRPALDKGQPARQNGRPSWAPRGPGWVKEII